MNRRSSRDGGCMPGGWRFSACKLVTVRARAPATALRSVGSPTRGGVGEWWRTAKRLRRSPRLSVYCGSARDMCSGLNFRAP